MSEQAKPEIDPNDVTAPGGGEYEHHPVRSPKTKFSEGELVQTPNGVGKIVAVKEDGGFQVAVSVTQAFTEAQLQKVA